MNRRSMGPALVASLAALCAAAMADELAPAPFDCASMPPSTGPAPRSYIERCRKVRPLQAPARVDTVGPVLGHVLSPLDALVQFDVATPGTLGVVVPMSPSLRLMTGMDFVQGNGTLLYMLDEIGNEVYTITETGTSTLVGACVPAAGHTWSGMHVDPTTGTFYAASTNIGTSTLYTINPATGAPTVVGNVTNAPGLIAIAFDNGGQGFGYDLVADNFIRIDKATGAGTIVGPLGFDANFSQDMDFDPVTNTCYLFAFNGPMAQAELRTANTTTGATTLVGILGTGDQMVGAVIGFLAGCTISPTSLPSGQVGFPYSQLLTGAGGTPPYAFTVSAGSLPPGLALGGGGAITGIPTLAGTYPFTVRMTDAASCDVTQPYSIAIDCGVVVVAPASLAIPVIEGQPESQTFTASGGSAPYTFAVTAGSLPPGLSLSSGGALTGTPTTPGPYAFTVTATDVTACTGSRPYAVEVLRAPNVVVGQGHGQPNLNRVLLFDFLFAPTTVDFLAYGAGQWGVNVASGDIGGDFHGEILTGPGPGAVFGPQVRGFDRTGVPMGKVNFYAYGTLRYGVNVAGSDIDADPFDEMLSGAGPGEVFGPHVRGWNFDGTALSAISKVSYFAYFTLKYGVNVAGGFVDGDAFAEILTAPGPGVIFGPQVRGWNYDGASVTSIAKINFNAFSTPQYGASAASDDLDGTDATELDEIACAAGPGPAIPSQLRGFNYDGVAISALPGYDAVAFTTMYGARAGLRELHTPPGYPANYNAELLAGGGPDPGADSTLRRYLYIAGALAPNGSILPFGTSTYGVNSAGMEGGY